MKAAFSVWDRRIAPVFYVVRQILLVVTRSGRIVDENIETPADDRVVMVGYFSPVLTQLKAPMSNIS